MFRVLFLALICSSFAVAAENGTDDKNLTVNPNPDGAVYKVDAEEAVEVNVAVPGKIHLQHPDPRLVARVVAAIVQAQALKGSRYEVQNKSPYKDRGLHFVDMKMPSVQEILAVYEANKKYADGIELPQRAPLNKPPPIAPTRGADNPRPTASPTKKP